MKTCNARTDVHAIQSGPTKNEPAHTLPAVFALDAEHHVLVADLTHLGQPGLCGKPYKARTSSGEGEYERAALKGRVEPAPHLWVTGRSMSLLTGCWELLCSSRLSGWGRHRVKGQRSGVNGTHRRSREAEQYGSGPPIPPTKSAAYSGSSFSLQDKYKTQSLFCCQLQ